MSQIIADFIITGSSASSFERGRFYINQSYSYLDTKILYDYNLSHVILMLRQFTIFKWYKLQRFNYFL